VIDLIELFQHGHSGRRIGELSIVARAGPKDGVQVPQTGDGRRHRP
jgi:hypothetical protein